MTTPPLYPGTLYGFHGESGNQIVNLVRGAKSEVGERKLTKQLADLSIIGISRFLGGIEKTKVNITSFVFGLAMPLLSTFVPGHAFIAGCVV